MTETEKKIDAMFERLVPRTGKSGTVAGEIVRAVSRIGYRYWNDGDHLGIGYGREVCNPAGRYLSERCGGAVAEAVRNAWGIDDEELYVKMKLSGFKEKIREKCRQVVSGIKAQGKRALNGMAGFLRLREGVERLKGVTEKMAGRLDALSESVEQEREISMQRKADKAVKGSEKPEQAEPAQKPHFTYQDEVQDFMGQVVAENKSYGSGADAFDAFMAYREGKGTKEQTGTAGRTAMQQPFIPAAGQAR